MVIGNIKDRFYGAWWGAFLGDAIAMPTHGYTSRFLASDYGQIEDMVDAKSPHPENVMVSIRVPSLSPENDFMGEGRRALWSKNGTHPHEGFKAGQNTLPMLLALHLAASMCEIGGFDREKWMERYRYVMTSPGAHSDTFIPTMHRMYFENRQLGRDTHSNGCANAHMSDAVIFIPLMLYVMKSPDKAQIDIQRAFHIFTTGESGFNTAYFIGELIALIARGATLEDAMYTIMTPDRHFSLAFPYRRWIKNRDDEQAIAATGRLAVIEESMPLSLYLSLKYGSDIKHALCVNANIGGDTTGRGAIMGMILGAQTGFSNLPKDMLAKLSFSGEIAALADMLYKLCCYR